MIHFVISELIPLYCLVGMVKQPTDHSSDFQMSNEDFPALPGAPPRLVYYTVNTAYK